MSNKVIIVIINFIIILSTGSAWLIYNIDKRKKLYKKLMALPKNQRYFWYLLRKNNFKVINFDTFTTLKIKINNNLKSYSIKADFIAKKNGKKYACLFFYHPEEKEYIKLFYSFLYGFNINGVVFYNRFNKSFSIWEN